MVSGSAQKAECINTTFKLAPQISKPKNIPKFLLTLQTDDVPWADSEP